jgi:protein involved in polysaccharide export with SLBB domain
MEDSQMSDVSFTIMHILNRLSAVRRWMLDVGCWMLDVSDIRRHLPSPISHLLSSIFYLVSLLGALTVGAAQAAPSTNTPLAAVGALTNAAPAIPANLTGYVPDDKYKLRAGDKVAFQILEDRDAPKSLMVADSGELDVPYVGRVTAVDKTSKQLADELKAQLEKEYYYRATVIIALDVANKFLGRIYVWGQVRNQGPIDIAINENLTAGRAILRAGGFGDFANKKKVKVVRGGGADGTAGKQSFELNMVDILEEGKTEKDVLLQPDDFIIVPSRLINF